MRRDVRLIAPVVGFFRRGRMRRFGRWTKLTPNARILDVGGMPYYWLYDGLPKPTLLNLGPRHPTIPDDFEYVEGDGRDLPYSDRSFDLAFSASVIEHLGTWENQQRFASELRRVGASVYCQTPAKAFPLEPHYLVPFIHWLPKRARRPFVRNFTPWGWMARPSREEVAEKLEEIRLLSYGEMRTLFPDCEIKRERLLGLTRAYIAVRD